MVLLLLATNLKISVIMMGACKTFSIALRIEEGCNRHINSLHALTHLFFPSEEGRSVEEKST